MSLAGCANTNMSRQSVATRQVSTLILESPGVAQVKSPYRFWFDLCVWMIKLPRLGPLNIDHSVNNGMCDMDISRSEFSCQRLCQCPHGKLARRKGRALGRTLHGCGRRCENQSRGELWRGINSLEKQWEGGLGEVEGTASGTRLVS